MGPRTAAWLGLAAATGRVARTGGPGPAGRAVPPPSGWVRPRQAAPSAPVSPDAPGSRRLRRPGLRASPASRGPRAEFSPAPGRLVFRPRHRRRASTPSTRGAALPQRGGPQRGRPGLPAVRVPGGPQPEPDRRAGHRSKAGPAERRAGPAERGRPPRDEPEASAGRGRPPARCTRRRRPRRPEAAPGRTDHGHGHHRAGGGPDRRPHPGWRSPPDRQGRWDRGVTPPRWTRVRGRIGGTAFGMHGMGGSRPPAPLRDHVERRGGRRGRGLQAGRSPACPPGRRFARPAVRCRVGPGPLRPSAPSRGIGSPPRDNSAVIARRLPAAVAALRPWPPEPSSDVAPVERGRDRLERRRDLARDDPERAAGALGELRQRLQVLLGQQLRVGIVACTAWNTVPIA